MSEQYMNMRTNFRVGEVKGTTIRECDCIVIEGSFQEFAAWVSGSQTSSQENSFCRLPPNDGSIFVYADYKHFVELFSEDDIPLFGDWASLGLSAVDSSKCTLWLGTRGCHTPLHYDSYGWNVIVQVD
jgi:HSPB1-associated protein 1